MREGMTFSVSQLNEYVNSLLRQDMLLSGVGLRGEISGFKRHSSGHLYFSLKDDAALIRCVMFRQNAWGLQFTPRDGQQVLLRGNAALYVKDGQYQFYVDSMQEEGEGALYAEFLRLKAKLEAEGLFDASRKKAIPAMPRCVGIITSPTGAVIRDIANVAKRRFPKMNLLLYPVRVQGAGAAEEIAAAIADMDRMKKADVLLLARGGGSLEDLWAFNEEIVARAIAACKTPVVSAVGHETDFTIADFAADLRAPTPSAAAELAVPEYDRAMQELDDLRASMRMLCENRVQGERASVCAIRDSAALAAPRHRLDAERGQIGFLCGQMRRDIRAALANAAHGVSEAEATLGALAPERVLQRGYAMVRKQDGFTGTALSFAVGEQAQVLMRDGTLSVRVDSIEGK